MSTAARLELRPSPALAAAIIAGHAAAAAAAYMVVSGVMGAALAAGLLALGVAAAWSRALLRTSGAVRAIEIGGPQVVFQLANGASFATDVAARRYVTRYLVALQLGRPLMRTLLVTADMLGAQEFRRLRIWALWNRLPGVAATQLPA